MRRRSLAAREGAAARRRAAARRTCFSMGILINPDGLPSTSTGMKSFASEMNSSPAQQRASGERRGGQSWQH